MRDQISLINRAIRAGRKQGRAVISAVAFPAAPLTVPFVICAAENIGSENARRFSAHYYSDDTGFFWGDYDLTEDEALAAFRSKRAREGCPSTIVANCGGLSYVHVD